MYRFYYNAGMRSYIQLGKGKPFSWRNFLLNSLELYLSDRSQRIVTIVFPGPNFLPNLIAPAIFTPQLVPKLKPSFWIRSYKIGNDSLSLIENAPSILASAKLAVTLLEPIPSVIELPSPFSSPFSI